MFGISIKDERGGALIMSIYFMILIGMIGISLLTMTISDTQLEIISAEECKAFYAAQSGLEYGTKRVLVTNPASFSNWTETIWVGNRCKAKISVTFLAGDKFRVSVEGRSKRFVKKLEKEIEYIDVSKYAIYTTGNIYDTITHEWPPSVSGGGGGGSGKGKDKDKDKGKKDKGKKDKGKKDKGKGGSTISHMGQLVYENAEKLPVFDLDELKNLAKPSGYYNNSLYVNSGFSFSPNRHVFVENDLTFSHQNWLGWGHFTVLNHTEIKSAWLPFATTFGTLYMPTAYAEFYAPDDHYSRSFIGGVITNGDISGGYYGKLYVFHHQSTIFKFMQSSVNGGPLIITKSKWKNLN